MKHPLLGYFLLLRPDTVRANVEAAGNAGRYRLRSQHMATVSRRLANVAPDSIRKRDHRDVERPTAS